MVSDKLLDALNEQMKNEFFSAYLYMAMAGYFEDEDLPGIASWMRVQALEEMTHGEKFFNFIADAGARIDLRGFDTRFEIGNMEDEDYVLRARLAGFRNNFV